MITNDNETNLIPTCEVVKEYLIKNGFSSDDLTNVTKCSFSTLYRFLCDKSKITYEIAEGINKLIPQISIDFLLTYDSKYQYNKNLFLKENNLDSKKLNKTLDLYCLKKLFPEYKSFTGMLIKKSFEIFGKQNVLNLSINSKNIDNVFFSKANNQKENCSKAWILTSYHEICSNENLLDFNYKNFINNFAEIKKYSNLNSIQICIFYIQNFCKKCGINFYIRKSIPNARIKAVSFKDINGKIFIFMSDLFKSVENFWISFVHECLHIKSNDLSIEEIDINEKEGIEKYIENETIDFFLEKQKELIFNKNLNSKDLYDISKKVNIPIGLVAEIYRYLNKDYTNYEINNYIHIFEDDQFIMFNENINI